MTHFAIGKLFSGKFELIEGTKEEILRLMDNCSNKGSEKFETIRVYSYSSHQTKRLFKQLETETEKSKSKKNG